MAAIAIKSKLLLNEQHDYITLKTPNGSFTCSRSGFKMSGLMATVPGLFDKLVKFVEENSKDSTYGVAMRKLTDESIMTEFWIDWNKEITTDIQVGDEVTIPSALKYGVGKVLELKKGGKSFLVDFPGIGKVGVPINVLKKN